MQVAEEEDEQGISDGRQEHESSSRGHVNRHVDDRSCSSDGLRRGDVSVWVVLVHKQYWYSSRLVARQFSVRSFILQTASHERIPGMQSTY